ncbi:hypothetical protein [Sphingobium sp. EP60837]|uniref:hypothetical protein n=1 Tax=Sphingobium sp. EP60837 TaxID=1855519 RepID=UPI0007DCC86F|nr:hypothetical protein [Sphingobium sp. EP60837]ANI78995.1 hypothetical protein EP837_02600 [Sphingobium sp. EP60837]
MSRLRRLLSARWRVSPHVRGGLMIMLAFGLIALASLKYNGMDKDTAQVIAWFVFIPPMVILAAMRQVD